MVCEGQALWWCSPPAQCRHRSPQLAAEAGAEWQQQRSRGLAQDWAAGAPTSGLWELGMVMPRLGLGKGKGKGQGEGEGEGEHEDEGQGECST